MSVYWAKFEENQGNVFRIDTRIYLKDIDAISDSDYCLGAIVGKNPGSAKANNLLTNKLQPIDLDGDKLLPTVRNIMMKSYEENNIPIINNAYIQVLNLFYLCDENLNRAIEKIKNIDEFMHIEDDSENKSFPFVWYVWGGYNKKLSSFKERFFNLDTKNNFFYDHENKIIKNFVPLDADFAKHTQGLKHDFVIPYISKILKNS